MGAACIFEYHNENVEVIRSTKRFAETIGGTAFSVEEILINEFKLTNMLVLSFVDLEYEVI